MNRTPVDSSNVHSIGHDATGLEVQFHSKGCALRSRSGDGVDQTCNCAGGDVYHHADIQADLHAELMAAPSVGAHYNKHVRNAKNAKGELLYPAVKR
jgi:hypothetical protein